MDMSDCPRILREFLTYHETIKGQSRRTISEYYLDLRMFFRFLIVFRDDRLPYDYDLNQVSIQDVDLNFVSRITPTEIYEFFVYLGNDRVYHTETQHPGKGVENAARARKLSAIKSFFKYLTVSTKQLAENPAADIEFPKLRRALPKYLTGGRGGVCRVLRLGAGGSGLPAGAGYFAACLAGHAVPGGRSGLRPAAPRAAAHPHNGTGTAYACASPGANAHSFADAGTKPYAAAQHRTANRGRRAYPGRAVPPRQGRGQHLTFGGQHPQQHRLCRRRPAGGGDHRQPAFCRGAKQR